MARIELDLSRDTSSLESSIVRVVGSCAVEGGQTQTFVGWAELLALLENSLVDTDSNGNESG